MAHSSSDGHVGYIVGLWIVGSCKIPGMPSQHFVSRDGNFSTDSALRKFQRFTGSLWAGTVSLGDIIREGRCSDQGCGSGYFVNCFRFQ